MEELFPTQADFHREVGRRINVTPESAKGTFHAFLNDRRPLPVNHRAAYIDLGIPADLLDALARRNPPNGTALEWLALVPLLLKQDLLSPELRAVAEAAAAELERSGQAALLAAADVRDRLARGGNG